MPYTRKDIVQYLDKEVNKELRTGEWLVYPEADYKLKKSPSGYRYVEVGEKHPYIVDLSTVEFYQPLVSHQDLFLRFARLNLKVPGPISWSDSLTGYPQIFDEYDYSRLDTDKNADAALSWVRDYGVLGLTSGMLPRNGGEPLRRGGCPEGGPEDMVWRFVVEWYIAQRTLKLYEAATDPDGVDLATIQYLSPTLLDNESPESARRRALDSVARIVERMIADRCHLTVLQKSDGLVQGWSFKSLLGAMWLQMLWLVTADSGRRCQRPECNGVVTIEKPKPEELEYRKWEYGYRPTRYATRKDKIYCTPSCKTLASRGRKQAQRG